MKRLLGRRAFAHLFARQGLPQKRGGRAAQPRVHHARVVPRRCRVERRSPRTPRRWCGSARARSAPCARAAARSSRRGRGSRWARRASASAACASTATRTSRPCAAGQGGRLARARRTSGGDFGDVFFGFFLDAVEPHLGRDEPTLVYDWPRPLCALARHKPADPRVVERFEVYAAGLELCNAFGELTDADEQRRRLESDLRRAAAPRAARVSHRREVPRRRRRHAARGGDRARRRSPGDAAARRRPHPRGARLRRRRAVAAVPRSSAGGRAVS